MDPLAGTAVEYASREVTRFDAELVGEIAPFWSVLLRTESAASSNIENLTAPARAIAEAELPGAKTTANAKVIVANTAAMIAAINLADNIDGDAILAMHQALMGDLDPRSAGQWREEQVWIGGGTHGPRGAVSCHRTTAVLKQPSTTCSASRGATISLSCLRSRWHTRNSRRFIRSPTATVAQAGH